MKWMQRGLGVGLLAILVIIGVFLTRQRPVSLFTGQRDSPLTEQAPVLEQISAWVSPTPQIVFVSPLPMPPFPTPIPTPAVTRVPIIAPPYLAANLQIPAQEYTVFLRDNNVVKSVSSNDSVERVLVDVHEQTSLFLGRPENNVWVWGSASSANQFLALVLTDFERQEDLGQRGLPTYKEPHYYIYLYNLVTGEFQLLLENAMKPVWSPDGTRLAYLDTTTHGLNVIDIATKEREEIFSVEPDSEHQADWFTWSPDGKRMAVVKTWSGFATVGGVWIVEAKKGGQVRQIIEMDANIGELIWSPGNDALLYQSEQGTYLTPELPRNIWLVDLESGSRAQVTHNMMALGANWSPDGKWIIIGGTNLLEGEVYQYDLWLAARGGELQRLTDDPTSDLNPIWTPDGQKVVFNKKDRGLWELDLNGGVAKQIVPQINAYWFLR